MYKIERRQHFRICKIIDDNAFRALILQHCVFCCIESNEAAYEKLLPDTAVSFW